MAWALALVLFAIDHKPIPFEFGLFGIVALAAALADLAERLTEPHLRGAKPLVSHKAAVLIPNHSPRRATMRVSNFWRTFRAMPGIVQYGIAIAAVILIALALPPYARADSIAKNGADWVRLTARPCENAEVIAAIQAKGLEPGAFWAASAHVDGKDFAACWLVAPGGAGLIFDDGDVGYVPQGDLKAIPEA